MKFVPRHNDIVGRYVLKQAPVESLILRPGDPSKESTKFILVDAVGPEAEANGIKVGDIVLIDRVATIQLDGGAICRAITKEPDCRMFVDDVDMSWFIVQTDNGKKFVPLDHPEAARPIGGKRPGPGPAVASSNGQHDVTGVPA